MTSYVPKGILFSKKDRDDEDIFLVRAALAEAQQPTIIHRRQSSDTIDQHTVA
jgi:hypothetical protein